jgi:hypothetical protein
MAPRGIAFAQSFMVSSTMNDLRAERMAAYSAVQSSGHVAWISETPPWTSTSSTASLCIDMAARCDRFILILGPRYGFTPQGRFAFNEDSVTELEYLAARADNPRKIVVCLQQDALETSNERQWRFIHEVLQYHGAQSVLRFKAAESLRRRLQAYLPHPVIAPASADILTYVKELGRRVVLPVGVIELGLRTTSSVPAQSIAVEGGADFLRGSLSDLLARFRHIAIVADPGSGKTTLMTMFAKTAADRIVESVSAQPGRTPLVSRQRAPIFLRARELSRALQTSAGNSARAVASAVATAENPRGFTAVEALVSKGDAILLVDGLDEVASQRDLAELIDALRRLEANEMVISTRPAVAASLPSTWRVCQIQQLDDAQVSALIRTMPDSVVAERFEDALASRYDLRVLVGNPLTLSLLVQLYLRTGQLPNEQADLFRLTFNMGVIQGESQESRAFDRVLAQVGLDMVVRGRRVFSYSDLGEAERQVLALAGSHEPGQFDVLATRSAVLHRATSDSWAFVSLWTQEYFAALALANLSPSEREIWLRRQTVSVVAVRWDNVFSLLLSELRSRGRLEEAENTGRLLLELSGEVPDALEGPPTSEADIPMRPRVFVSHSSRDNTFTRQLVTDLQRRDVQVWVDYAEITDGMFLERIDAALSRADWMILVLSAHALASRYVMLEYYAALTQERKGNLRGVIPVIGGELDDESVPPTLDSLHRWDGRRDYGVALQGVYRALGVDVA